MARFLSGSFALTTCPGGLLLSAFQGACAHNARTQPSSEAFISLSRARGRALLSHARTPGCAALQPLSPAGASAASGRAVPIRYHEGDQ